MKFLRIVLRVIATLLALFILLMVALQVVLSPGVCTSLIQKYSPDFIDGKLSLGSASVSVLSHFPAVTLDMDDFVISYPSRYTDQDSVKAVHNFLELAGVSSECVHCSSGQGQAMDTLASFRKLSVSVNVLALLYGDLRIKNVEFESPRAYVHIYGDGHSNLEVLKLPTVGQEDKSEADTSSYVLRQLLVKKFLIDRHSWIVYTDRTRDLYALMMLGRMDCKGKISAKDPLGDSFGAHLDSLMVTGNYNSDTLLFALHSLALDNDSGTMAFSADASAFAATRSFGRLRIPLRTAGNLRIWDAGKGRFNAALDGFTLDVASAHLGADVQASVGDTIGLKGHIAVPGISVGEFLGEYLSRFVPDAAKIHTDATVSAALDVDGFIIPGTKTLPAFQASLDIPLSNFSMDGYDFCPELEIHAAASAHQGGALEVRLPGCSISAPGLNFSLKGSCGNVLASDPKIYADFALDASVAKILEQTDSLVKFSGSGNIDAKGSGNFRISNLDLYNLQGIEFDSSLGVHSLALNSTDDSLKIYCNEMKVSLGKLKAKKGVNHRPKSPRFGFRADVDSLSLDYAGKMLVNGSDLAVISNARTDLIKVSDSLSYNPLRFSFNAAGLYYMDADSVSIRIRDTKNSISIRPEKGVKSRTPRISITSSNDRMRLNFGPHRFSLKDLDFKASAKMHDDSRRRRAAAFKDSLLKAHPDWNEDTLRSKLEKRRKERTIPDWLADESLRKSDFDFSIGQTFKRYLTSWDVGGSLALGRARVFTPAFPQKTSLEDFKGSFDNDRVSLDSMRVVSASSDLEACGSVSGLRRVIAGRGIPKLRLQISSDTLALNELIATTVKGQQNLQKNMEAVSAMSDEQYDAMVAQKMAESGGEASADSTVGMIVVPANLDAEIGLRGHGASYSTLDISSFSADMRVRHRTVVLSDLNASSNMGNLHVDAFYSSVSRSSLTSGFNLEFNDISAAQVISLIPQFDTLMPLLKTFDGMLNCSIAATASLDTNMNIIPDSMDGVIRINGSNLRFTNNKQVEKLARILLFREPKDAHVDSMTVEGIIGGNKLEIFPFILKMDRWTVAIAGVQGLDKTFSYHASLLKSPLVVKLGANLYGEDFDDIRFKLGKPRFKKEESIPSFTKVIDTTRLNLVDNIRSVLEQGVEKALRENRAKEAIEDERKALDYLHSASLDTLGTLSDAERRAAGNLNPNQ